MKRFGIIGNPLEHSFSSNYFRNKFLSENISDAIYENFVLDSVDEVPHLIKQYPDLAGLNVTLPFKQQIIPILDEVHDDAREIGAVNTIKIVVGKLKGYNTDAPAFLRTLNLTGSTFKKAIVLGTGGASKAVCYALDQLMIDYLMVSRRMEHKYITYQELNEAIISNCDLIINTTPVGMYPHVNAAPDIPYEIISEKHFLYDLIYNPQQTEFLKRGSANGAKTINGLEMLKIQAELTWDIWVNGEG